MKVSHWRSVMAAVLGLALTLTLAGVPAQAANPYTSPIKFSESVVSVIDQATRLGQNFDGPTLIRLPDGSLLSTHDSSGPAGGETIVFRSTDEGQTWTKQGSVPGWRNQPFVHDGQLLMIGLDDPMTGIVLHTSGDNGATWVSTPIHSNFWGYWLPTTPIVVAHDRVWAAVDLMMDTGSFFPVTLSAPVTADLMDPASWTMSDTAYNGSGYERGNLVIAPTGDLWMVLGRPDVIDGAGYSVVSPDGRSLSDIVPITLRGADSPFEIQRDPVSGGYFAMTNITTDSTLRYGQQRNQVVLQTSADLVTWHIGKYAVVDDSGLPWPDSVEHIGFNEPAWMFDGDDILFVLGTADSTDPNRSALSPRAVTFHRLLNYGRFYEPFNNVLISNDFEDYWEYDGGSGPGPITYLPDESYEGFSSEVVGGDLVEGPFSLYLHLNGDNSYIDLDHHLGNETSGQPNVSIGFVLRRDPGHTEPMWLFGSEIAPGIMGLQAIVHGDKLTFGARSTPTDRLQTVTVPFVDDGQFHSYSVRVNFLDDLMVGGGASTDTSVPGPTVVRQVNFHSDTYRPGPVGYAEDRIGAMPVDSRLDGVEMYSFAGDIDEFIAHIQVYRRDTLSNRPEQP